MALTVTELRERQEEIAARMREIDSQYPGQALPDDAREEFNRLRQERLDNEGVIEELVLREEQLSELGGDGDEEDERRESSNQKPRFQTRTPRSTDRGDIFDLSTIRGSAAGPEEMRRELHERAHTAVERSVFPHEAVDKDAAVRNIGHLLEKDSADGWLARRILNTGSPIYTRAFTKAILGSQLSPEESRALSLTGEFGGYAVPFVLDPTIIPTSNGVVNPMREISRVETIVNSNVWKGVSSSGVAAEYSGEAEETEEAEFKIAQPEIEAHRASTLILASFEITQDWVGIQGEIGKAIQDAKDALEAEKFWNGTGLKMPYGLKEGATETKETAEAGKFGIADLYTLKGALPPRYVPQAKFLATDAHYDRVRQFDTTGGSELWVQLKEGNPPVLLGKPAMELSTMDSKLEAGKLVMVYGDFSRYIIVDRLGMNIEVIQHVMNGKKATGQRGFYAFWRNGAKVVDKNGFRVTKVK